MDPKAKKGRKASAQTADQAQQGPKAKKKPIQPIKPSSLIVDNPSFEAAFGSAFSNDQNWEHESGAFVYNTPFTVGSIPKVFDEEFLSCLQKESEKIEFFQKDNDLYQFAQSDDLRNITHLPAINQLKEFLYITWRPWLQNVSKIELTKEMNLTFSKYSNTDYLLCHDDELEGRRIAFILYLIDEDWQEHDGGALGLFDTDVNDQPRQICRSLVPKRGSFSFFKVTTKSFHQVGEVLSENKIRLSINGWFYGTPFHRNSPWIETVLPLLSLVPVTDGKDDNILDTWMSWINETYLEAESMVRVQLTMEEDSNIELPDFLKQSKYDELAAYIAQHQFEFEEAGPKNRRNYDRLTLSRLGGIAAEFVALLSSPEFIKFLCQITQLELISASGEMRRFQHGSYSLVLDTDSSLREEALDFLFYCAPTTEWNPHHGGSTVYLAAGGDDDDEIEDQLLLIAPPKANSATLIFRDSKVAKFVKYINHNFTDSFVDFAFSYKEDESKQKHEETDAEEANEANEAEEADECDNDNEEEEDS